MPKIINTHSSQYQILTVFKENSSKGVYSAIKKDKDSGLVLKVLLKVFHKKDLAYQWEMESLLKIRSPYCAKLLNFEYFSGKKALVLEYIEGVSLSQLLENFKLSQSEIQGIVSSIYKGLQDLQDQNLCHGDLSLDNVLIDEQGQLKFIDFGKGNYEKSVQGTLPFVAPEILKGHRVSFFSDLFSLGIIEVVLKKSYRPKDLKKIKTEDLDLKDRGLTSSHPQQRGTYVPESTSIPKSLLPKIKHVLSSLEGRHCETEKLPVQSFFMTNLKQKSLNISFLLGIAFYVGFACFSNISSDPKSLLKVSTNEWSLISLDQFQSYAPFKKILSPGFYRLKWKMADAQGQKWIHIKTGQTLLLNDKDFKK